MTNRLTSIIALLTLSGSCLAADPATIVNADSALAQLKKGNAIYATNTASSSQPTEAARVNSIKSQHPIAVIVTCSDARTAPELIFNQNLDRLFVVRTAGNVLDSIGLGTIEYAVANLGVRLVVVMGHQNCGAVTAAVKGGNVPAHINSIVDQIKPAVAMAKKEQGDIIANSIQCNAILVGEKVSHDTHLGDAAKEVKVVPAVYSLETGKVTWLK